MYVLQKHDGRALFHIISDLEPRFGDRTSPQWRVWDVDYKYHHVLDAETGTLIKLPTHIYTLLVANAPLDLDIEPGSTSNLGDLSQLRGAPPGR